MSPNVAPHMVVKFWWRNQHLRWWVFRRHEYRCVVIVHVPYWTRTVLITIWFYRPQYLGEVNKILTRLP